MEQRDLTVESQEKSFMSFYGAMFGIVFLTTLILTILALRVHEYFALIKIVVIVVFLALAIKRAIKMHSNVIKKILGSLLAFFITLIVTTISETNAVKLAFAMLGVE